MKFYCPSFPKAPEPELRTSRNAAAMPRPVNHPLVLGVISADGSAELLHNSSAEQCMNIISAGPGSGVSFPILLMHNSLKN
jgi:hypothetical protein